MSDKRKVLLIVALIIALLIPQVAFGVSAESTPSEPMTLSNAPFYQGDVNVINTMIDNNVFFGPAAPIGICRFRLDAIVSLMDGTPLP